MTHTAGFDRYWNDAYRAARSDLRTVAGYLELFATTPLGFPPGTRHHYGNTGYVVLGALIEQVTGESYYDYMRQSIYLPLSMQDTDHYEMDLPIANCAVGYTRDNWFGPVDGQLRANHFIYAIKGSPSEHCLFIQQGLVQRWATQAGGATHGRVEKLHRGRSSGWGRSERHRGEVSGHGNGVRHDNSISVEVDG